MFRRSQLLLQKSVKRINLTSKLTFKPLTQSSIRKYETGSGIVGAPPIQIEDVYGLCFKYEPSFKTSDRDPEAMFKQDQKLNEVYCYLNGPQHKVRDNINYDFVMNMYEAHVIWQCRDAGRRPELLKILEREGGTSELPQVWIRGKLVASGEKLANLDYVLEVTAPARRPWPREKPYYQQGFYGYEGVTRSDEVMVRALQAQELGHMIKD